MSPSISKLPIEVHGGSGAAFATGIHTSDGTTSNAETATVNEPCHHGLCNELRDMTRPPTPTVNRFGDPGR
jgi:hypothetical protein